MRLLRQVHICFWRFRETGLVSSSLLTFHVHSLKYYRMTELVS